MQITLDKVKVDIDLQQIADNIQTIDDALILIRNIDINFSDWVFSTKVLNYFLNILWYERKDIENPPYDPLFVEINNKKIGLNDILQFIKEKVGK